MFLASQTTSPVPILQAGKAVEPVTDFLPGSTHEIRSILIIQNAELEDSGTYVCNVSEGYHEKTDRKDITVQVIGALLPTHPEPANRVGVQAGCPRVTSLLSHSLQLSPLLSSPLSSHDNEPNLTPCHPCPLLGFKTSQISLHGFCDPLRLLRVLVRAPLHCAVPR